MDENRLEGTARDLGGKVEQGIGRATGNVGRQAEGMTNQVAGAAQTAYGQAADATSAGAGNLDRWLRSTIEAQPYTSALVAMGIGWLLGRMHRPM